MYFQWLGLGVEPLTRRQAGKSLGFMNADIYRQYFECRHLSSVFIQDYSYCIIYSMSQRKPSSFIWL